MSQDTNVQDAIAKFKAKTGATTTKVKGGGTVTAATPEASAAAAQKVEDAHKAEEKPEPEAPKRDVAPKTFSVIISKMGNVTSLTTVMSMIDIYDRVTYASDLYDVTKDDDPTKELTRLQKEKAISPSDSWQRPLNLKRAANDITPYLEQDLHFFPPLICVIAKEDVSLEGTQITLTEHCLGALDGQHRLAGIVGEIQKNGIDGTFGQETMPVVIISEMPTDEDGSDIGTRQQIFADVNRTPKTVSKATNIMFDHRDRYAIIAKGVAEQWPNLVDYTHTSPSAKASQFGSLTNIYNLGLQFGSSSAKIKNAPLRNGPDGKPITDQDVASVVTAVIQSLPSFDIVRDQKIDYSSLRGLYLCYSSTLFQAIGYELKNQFQVKNVPVSAWVESATTLIKGTTFDAGNPIWVPVLKTSAKGKVSIGTRTDDVTAAIDILRNQWSHIAIKEGQATVEAGKGATA